MIHSLICPRSHGWSTRSNSNDATRSRVFTLHSPVGFWRTKGWLGWRESPENVEVHDRCPRNLPTSWADNTKSSWLSQGAALKIPYVIPTCSWGWEAVPQWCFSSLDDSPVDWGSCSKAGVDAVSLAEGLKTFSIFFFFYCYEVHLHLSQDLLFWIII